jgi:hypothetical protein
METCQKCGIKLSWDEIFEGEDLQFYCEDCVDIEESKEHEYRKIHGLPHHATYAKAHGFVAQVLGQDVFFVQYLNGLMSVDYFNEMSLLADRSSQLSFNLG